MIKFSLKFDPFKNQNLKEKIFQLFKVSTSKTEIIDNIIKFQNGIMPYILFKMVVRFPLKKARYIAFDKGDIKIDDISGDLIVQLSIKNFFIDYFFSIAIINIIVYVIERNYNHNIPATIFFTIFYIIIGLFEYYKIRSNIKKEIIT